MLIKSQYITDEMRGQLMAMAKLPKISLIVLTAAAIVLTASTFAAINVSQNLTSIGTIVTTPNIGVYSNSACTSNMTAIDWGSVAAGGNDTQVVYVKNTGTGSITLSLSANSWTPSGASSYITVTWNQAGTVLTAGQSVAATITLTVSASITGITTFSNTIMVSGTA
jgi:hypothetical protein